MVQPLYAVKKRPSLLKTILLAGLTAGTIDALFAIIDFSISAHANPVRISWFIASAVFGSASSSKALLEAGAGAQVFYALAGIFFHYFIAFCFVCFFFLIYPRLPFLQKNKFVTAIIYGCFAWLVMNYIVLPFFMGRFPSYSPKTILSVLYLIIAIGLTPVVFEERYRKHPSSSKAAFRAERRNSI